MCYVVHSLIPSLSAPVFASLAVSVFVSLAVENCKRHKNWSRETGNMAT